MIFNSNISKIEKGADLSDATATAADIVSGKTAYVSTGKVIGTLSELSNPNMKSIYPVSINITNNTNTTISVYWSNFSKSGFGNSMANIPKSSSKTISAYSGIVFLADQSYSVTLKNIASSDSFFQNVTVQTYYGIFQVYPDSSNLTCNVTIT